MKPMHADTLYYFNQGELKDAYEHFGAHLVKNDQGAIIATRFTVYAPHAKAVSVVGEFNDYQDWVHQLSKLDDSGVWRIEIPHNLEWKQYKYMIETHRGAKLYKADPYAFYSSNRPETTSKVYDLEGYEWGDDAYLATRDDAHPYNQPVSIYELHVGSWMQKPGGGFHTFAELVDLLIPYLKRNHFTHLELMPVYEHPLDMSWGYQGTGYYSVTSRYGVPKDLMYLVDRCHQENIRVILDWVPGHMCKDAHGLYMFDGEPLYEYAEEHIRENVVWGTANFDLGRGETRSFLISNALYFLKKFHIDGFRIDAVSNIIYYLGDSRVGENHGGQEFLKRVSAAIFEAHPTAILAAEDSTAHPKVTHPVEYGGLGFNYKWNMGWMNDTLKYFEKDPIYRKYHHHELTFSMHYAYSENYILPLSHDEVVHGKRSLVEKMPGDYWQKFANYRALLGYFYTHPGKTLLFMGGEFGHMHEWRDHSELDWHLLSYPMHDSALRYNRDMMALVEHEAALHALDHEPSGFQWIDQHNADQSILTYIRYAKPYEAPIVVVLNLTPATYHDYRIGVPKIGVYEEIMNSDKSVYGGSNLFNGSPLTTQDTPSHGFNQSITLTVAPLAVSLLKWRKA